MIGLIIKWNNTGKCLVLNKPKFKYFDVMKFKFKENIDQFIKVLFLFNDTLKEIEIRNQKAHSKFGRSNCRKLIKDMKVYDKKMLHRVHKLREMLKYEMNPKIRREIRIKYNKLKKTINGLWGQ